MYWTYSFRFSIISTTPAPIKVGTYFLLQISQIVWSCFFVTARVGLVHIGVFILLLLSGERNFGVRLNKPYTVRVAMEIPVFTGTHADLLVIVREKLFTFFFIITQP